jgi:hypothetical protein
MLLKRKLTNTLKSVKNKGLQVCEDELVMIGETLLDSKITLWDTEKLPFLPANWNDYGFKVFSQNNEDGLLQYIIHHTELPQKNFIEFGVENYSECNTRFLLLHNNWSGLVMDGSKEWMDALKKQRIYWKRTIESKGVFITKENINKLISESGFSGKVGLLSVDIDGNDYWVFEAIDCIEPQILICEYNPIFGSKEAVSIPYKSDFYRTSAHYSNLYYGASLRAFVHIADKRGYKLVCINNIGNNAFFVKRDSSDLPEVSIEEAWVDALYRESRDKSGKLTFLSLSKGRELLGKLPIVDVITGQKKKISELVIS